MRDDVDGVVFSDLPIGDDNAYGESPNLPKEIAPKDPKANSTLSIVQKFRGIIGKLIDEADRMLDLNTGPASESPNSSSADTISRSSDGSDGSGHSDEPSSNGDGSPKGTEDVSSLGKLSANELKSIGSPAENSGIRSVTGNSSDAFKFFKNQVNPSTIRETKPGVYVGNDGEGITFTYRATSKSGPPTIDVNGVQGLRKIKFIN